MPIATHPDRLIEVWDAFQIAATGRGAMPALLVGETLSWSPKPADPASPSRALATGLAA